MVYFRAKHQDVLHAKQSRTGSFVPVIKKREKTENIISRWRIYTMQEIERSEIHNLLSVTTNHYVWTASSISKGGHHMFSDVYSFVIVLSLQDFSGHQITKNNASSSCLFTYDSSET